MREITEYVVKEVRENFSRGVDACATRQEAERRAKRYGRGSNYTYVVEEGTRYEAEKPDEPPTDSREPEGEEES